MIDERAFAYVAGLLGVPFLAYVSGADAEAMTSRLDGRRGQISPASEGALTAAVECALNWIPVPPEVLPLAPDGNRPDGSAEDRMRRFGWVDMDREKSYANVIRELGGGALPSVPPGLDAAEAAIALAALDYYPVTLIPMPRPDQPSRELPIVSHARTDTFVAAVRADQSLAAIVSAEEMIWTSASALGFGAPTETRLMGCIIASAEQQVRMFGATEPSDFVAACVQGLNVVRRLSSGRQAEVAALVGFSHMSLPAGVVLDGPRAGRLRSARDSELRVPGTSTATLVLETRVPLRMVTSPEPPDDHAFFEASRLEKRDTEIVSLAGLLSTRGPEGRLPPRHTWVKTFDPLILDPPVSETGVVRG